MRPVSCPVLSCPFLCTVWAHRSQSQWPMVHGSMAQTRRSKCRRAGRQAGARGAGRSARSARQVGRTPNPTPVTRLVCDATCPEQFKLSSPRPHTATDSRLRTAERTLWLAHERQTELCGRHEIHLAHPDPWLYPDILLAFLAYSVCIPGAWCKRPRPPCLLPPSPPPELQCSADWSASPWP